VAEQCLRARDRKPRFVSNDEGDRPQLCAQPGLDAGRRVHDQRQLRDAVQVQLGEHRVQRGEVRAQSRLRDSGARGERRH
jgi:hypothetical protein